MPSRPRGLPVAAALACLGLVTALAGCGAGAADVPPGTVSVVAAFYPLQFAAEQVGGSHVHVTNLTRPGAEPHDLELSPMDVARVSRAQVVVYEKGLQSAVDQAVDQEAGDRALDVTGPAHLDLRYTPIEGGQASTVEAGSIDPHFWLDPTRYALVARAIADRLGRVDPAHRTAYEANAAHFAGRLESLDHELATGLAHCQRQELVTSHNAFGYLARRYHLQQVGITGLSPDAEPEPASLARVATYARSHGVTTIFAEALASPAIAGTVARETGARVAVLDPVEGLTSSSAGRDYVEVMRSNLAALRTGLGCA